MLEQLQNILERAARADGIDPDVARAARLMRERFARLRTVTDVAREAGVNYHTLRDKFRRQTRMTMAEFLARVCVGEAMRLLRDSDKLVKEVAWAVGYDYEDRLTRAFQKYMDMPPHLFRSRIRSGHLPNEPLDRFHL